MMFLQGGCSFSLLDKALNLIAAGIEAQIVFHLTWSMFLLVVYCLGAFCTAFCTEMLQISKDGSALVVSLSRQYLTSL